VDLCLILDPMLADRWLRDGRHRGPQALGATRIKLVNLIVAPEGVDAVTAAHPTSRSTARQWTGSSTSTAYIMPGLGDAAIASSGRAGPAESGRHAGE